MVHTKVCVKLDSIRYYCGCNQISRKSKRLLISKRCTWVNVWDGIEIKV